MTILKDSPIGFFDSGVGGLSVFKRFREMLPLEDTIYYGDLKNLPYGNKTKEELVGFTRNILNFFSLKNVKAVVIACNTSSALAYESIKNDYDFKIYPIIQSCAEVIASMNLSKVGVFATLATVKSKAYKKEIEKHNAGILVNEIACPNWVSFVESGNLPDKNNFEQDIMVHINEMMKFAPDKIVLGCTHYPYLLPILTKFAPRDLFIDPAEIFVSFIKHDLSKLGLLGGGSGISDFYVSANPDEFLKNSSIFYKLPTKPILIESVLA